MNKGFKPTRHRKNLRLPEFDYSQDGVYFITIVTQNRTCLFGTIVKGEMILNDAGKMVDQVCQEVPQFIPNVDLEHYVVIPNHFHGIIELSHMGQQFPLTRGLGRVVSSQARISLSNVVQRFKSLTTRRYIDGVEKYGWQRFDGRLWQRNYYEHVVRNERDYQAILDYIMSNPQNWEKDEEYRS